MDGTFRIRVRFGDSEFEVEGDRSFVEAQLQRLLDAIAKTPAARNTSAGKHSSADVVPSGDPQRRAPERPTSVNELLIKSRARSNADRLLLFAYYLETASGEESVNKNDLEDMFRQAKYPPPKNVNADMTSLVQQGLAMTRPQKKGGLIAWQLTKRGMDKVESMLAADAS